MREFRLTGHRFTDEHGITHDVVRNRFDSSEFVRRCDRAWLTHKRDFAPTDCLACLAMEDP